MAAQPLPAVRALEHGARCKNRTPCSRILFSRRFCGKLASTVPRDAVAAALVSIFFLVLASPAQAHKPSDSYLTLHLQGQQITGRWDIALRDLDFALSLDADGDGAIRWGEVKARRAQIQAYALSHLTIDGDGKTCWLHDSDLLIDQHSDGAYAVLALSGACPAKPQRVGVAYNLFADFDPQHRGLVRVTGDGRDHTLVLGGSRPRQGIAMTGVGRLREVADFIATGVFHIWTGFDHLLFLISLLLPAVLTRKNGQWVGQVSARTAGIDILRIVSAFTVAHSITLSLATLGVLSLPARLTEAAIALSVAFAAFNNLRPMLTGRIWIAAFVFGLIHGFGFANVLRDLGLAQASLLWALLAFNIGVEMGQVVVVGLLMPLAWRARNGRLYRKVLVPFGSMAILLIATVWFIQRALGISFA